jgi:transcription elongation factor SPT6
MGGAIVNREQFITERLLTTKIFLNAAGFLRISQDEDLSPHSNDSETRLDPLDSTRIHPEDYELARKMAAGALELDD